MKILFQKKLADLKNELNPFFQKVFSSFENYMVNLKPFNQKAPNKGLNYREYFFQVGLTDEHINKFINKILFLFEVLSWIENKQTRRDDIRIVLNEVINNIRSSILKNNAMLIKMNKPRKITHSFIAKILISETSFDLKCIEQGEEFDYFEYLNKSLNHLNEIYSDNDIKPRIEHDTLTINKENILITKESKGLGSFIIEGITNQDYYIISLHNSLNELIAQIVHFGLLKE